MDIQEYYNKFTELLEQEDRYESVKYVKGLLDDKKINIVQLYEDIIAPSLRNITCKVNEKDMCIWQEHVRSAITRTVIECCYTYVVEEAKERDNINKGTVVVLCPQDEYHDIGARMISDLFIISGYSTIFVGSDTPKSDFLAAVNHIKPDYIAISVTNYYNIVAAKDAIEDIKNKADKEIKILAGGSAFNSNKEAYKTIGADYYINTFADIEAIGGV